MSKETSAIWQSPYNSHPILFSAPMVQAILEGRKTQTRRVITRMNGMSEFVSEDGEILSAQDLISKNRYGGRPYRTFCPHGKTRDQLWVRETWAVGAEYDKVAPSKLPKAAREKVWLRADGGLLEVTQGRWRPSIFMPRWASRITLEITDVRVERVNDISDIDILKEGTPGAWVYDEYSMSYSPNGNTDSYRFFFNKLWDKINAKRGHPFSNNDWVWVVEFKKL